MHWFCCTFAYRAGGVVGGIPTAAARGTTPRRSSRARSPTIPGKVHEAYPHLSDDDVRFGLILIATTLLGDAIFGGRIREAIGTPDGEEARRSYRAWLSALFEGPQRVPLGGTDEAIR